MSVKVKVQTDDGNVINTVDLRINKTPDSCPLCHKNIIPEQRYGWLEDDGLQMIFQCPNDECRRLFIGYYIEGQVVEGTDVKIEYFFRACAPHAFEKKDFPKEVTNISKKFCETYNEALEAEKRGLKNVCGAGYRKALEALIKDYLIKEKVEKSEIIAIAETPLIDCINQYINSQRIKDCAQRAAWLGKDEAQYIRIWKSKDIEDLKDIIKLTVNWIQDEHLTERIKKDMPDRKSKSKNE